MIKMNYEYVNNNSESTVVFLHGWGLNGDSFNKIISGLNGNFSILKVDLPGFGHSQNAKDYFDTHEYAYQIFLLLNKINIKNIILVGHSFGGRLAILLSSIYNINVSNLILTSSAGINRFDLKKWLKVKWFKFIKFLTKIKLIKEEKLKKYGSQDYKKLSSSMRQIFIKIINQDLRKFVKKIHAKNIFLVWDKKDKDTPYFICKKIYKLTKNSKIILYKNGGHFVAFKNPNKFANLINSLV